MHVIGAYRFDDPEGQVGMETFIVQAGEDLLHVPLTYRNEALAGHESSFVGEMLHSELGTRYVYDGLGDAQFVTMMAAVSMTGQGEALGLAVYDGRWFIAPTNVRIRGGGWTQERVAVDGFDRVSDDASGALLRSDEFELVVSRRLATGPQPAIGLTATWETQSDPVVLATITQR